MSRRSGNRRPMASYDNQWDFLENWSRSSSADERADSDGSGGIADGSAAAVLPSNTDTRNGSGVASGVGGLPTCLFDGRLMANPAAANHSDAGRPTEDKSADGGGAKGSAAATPSDGSPRFCVLSPPEAAAESFTVNVESPELRSGGLQTSFVVYEVSGRTPSGLRFSAWKRYKDFVWMHSVLCSNLPGVRIPVLPGKRAVGRFDAPFIETRRQGLRDFLVRIFNRPHICSSSIFLQWLQRGEASLAALAQELSCQSWGSLFEEYKNLTALMRPKVAVRAGSLGMADTRRLDSAKVFLKAHYQYIRRLMKTVNRLTLLRSAESDAIVELHSAFLDVAKHESNSASDFAVDLRQVSCRNSSQYWQLEKALRADYRTGNFSILQKGVIREMHETESMLAAVESVDRLTRRKYDLGKKLDDNANRINGNQGIGGLSLDGIASLFSRNNDRKENAFAEERVIRDTLTVLCEWESWAFATVFASFSVFYTEKVELFNSVMEEFARNQMNFLYQEADIWKDYIKVATLGTAGLNALSSSDLPHGDAAAVLDFSAAPPVKDDLKRRTSSARPAVSASDTNSSSTRDRRHPPLLTGRTVVHQSKSYAGGGGE